MENNLKIFITGIFIFSFLSTLPNLAVGQELEDINCAVYFTGVGCPHCANTDPVILKDKLSEYTNLTIIEYEIYQNRENAPLLEKYSNKFNTGLGIPNIIFGVDNTITGDRSIINNIDKKIEERKNGICPLLNESLPFSELNLNKIPGKPKIWIDEKVLVRTGEGITPDEYLKKLLLKEPENVIEDIKEKNVKPEPVALSGSEVNFKNAVQMEGWKLQWERGQTEDEDNVNGSQENKSQVDTNLLLIIGILIIFVLIAGWIRKR
ncbi:MAG: hypothetical protein ABEK36_06105 [Candidatus Aenigmatarchaeota archaeon]